MAVKHENTPSLIGSIQGEVAAEASPMLQFLIDNTRYIVLGIILFIIAIVGYWLYTSNVENTRAERQLEFGRLLIGKTGPERITALEEYLKTAPSSLHAAAWFAIAEAAQMEQDYPKTYQAWEQIAKLDPEIKVTATLAMAQSLEEQKKDQAALDLLDSISSGLNSADQYNVNTRITILAENLGNYDRAIAACEAIAANPDVAGDAVFWRQKLLVLQKKASDASTPTDTPKKDEESK
jgi:predicted negative regulator of RcsB-dependent stress response